MNLSFNKVMRVSSKKYSKELGLFSQDIAFRNYSINENKKIKINYKSKIAQEINK